MGKRIVVCILFVPSLLWWMIQMPFEYIITGTVDPMNTPMDKLTRWAK